LVLARIVLFLLLFTLLPVSANTPLLQDPRFASVNSDTGLNQNTINDLLLDKQGFLWIATGEGLSRFDGNELFIIHGDKGVLTNNPVNALFEDEQGKLWLSSAGQGIFVYDKYSDQITELPKEYYSLTEQWVQGAETISRLNEHDIVIAYHEKVVAYDQKTLQARTLFELSQDDIEKDRWIRDILVEQNVLFIATNQGLIGMDVEANSSKEIDFLQDLQASTSVTLDAKSLLRHQQDSLLVGTIAGLYKIPLGALIKHVSQAWALPNSVMLDQSRNIWSMANAVNGNTYIGTDIGVFELDSQGNLNFLFEPKIQDMEISDKRIRSMVSDKNGNLWFGTEYNGALFWTRSSLIFQNKYNRANTEADLKLSDNNILTIHQKNADTLWMGTNNGLTKLSLKDGTTKRYLMQDYVASLYSDSNISQILSTDNESLWLMTGETLRKFSLESESFVSLPPNPSQSDNWLGQYMWGMAKQDNQFIWGLFDKGFYKIDTKTGLGKFHPVSEDDYPLAGMLTIIKYDKKSKKIIISAYGTTVGLHVETGEFDVIHTVVSDTFQTQVLPQSYLRDRNNNIWISYPGKGLFKLDGESYEEIHHYTTSENLPSNLIYELTQDEIGNIWFSSHSGIHMMDTETSVIVSFSNMHGLSSSEFNAGASEVLSDGRFAFGGTRGVTVFSATKAREIHQNAANSPFITELRLASQNLVKPIYASNQEKLELKHSDYGLKIYFSTLDYASLKGNRYVFELSSESNTIKYPPTKNSFVHLPTLNPGQYTLSAHSLTGQYVNEQATKINIIVKHAPWLSPFAYAVYITLFVLIIGSYLYKRYRHQQTLASANQQITVYNSRLTSALKASQSDIWEWSSASNLMDSPRLHQELGYGKEQQSVSFENHVCLIHESDRLQYLNAWRHFIRGNTEQFDITYRMLSSSGIYNWFRDAGSINSKTEDNDVIVTGTYTNVTEDIASKERLKLFGDAFEHTKDWVLIFDKERVAIAANSSFLSAFHIHDKVNLNSALSRIFDDQIDLYNNLFTRLITLKPGDNYKTEITLTLNSRKVTIITDINTIELEDNQNEIQHYLVIMTDITEQKEAQYALQKLANYDVLTGLINRTLLVDRLEQSIKSAKRHDYKIALLFIDLDRFKPINDTFGHEAGDIVLVEVSNRLRARFREQDSVARLGGDEFVVVLEEIDAIDSVNKIVAELLIDLERAIPIINQTISISASIGISLFPDDGIDAELLLRNADVAMYNAKQTGKNRFQHYTESMNLKVQKDMLLQNKVKVAAVRQEFENYYQPIVDVFENKTAGFEMLMRWNSEGEFIPPDVFIPITEQLGLIKELTMQAIERAVEDLSVWYANGFDGYVAINLSAKQFSTRPDFERILRMLSRKSLPTSCLRFEITEGLLIDDNSNTIDYMLEMRQLGFKISLDDFGTGYSSLKYLKDFPIDIVKIDKSFVDEIGLDEGTESIIKSTLIMTEMLQIDTVAEGIETQKQLAYFIKTKCRYIQGYFFAKPANAAVSGEYLFEKWLSDERSLTEVSDEINNA
jgi:diguanylate cyclase (GGDEF)-like protein